MRNSISTVMNEASRLFLTEAFLSPVLFHSLHPPLVPFYLALYSLNIYLYNAKLFPRNTQLHIPRAQTPMATRAYGGGIPHLGPTRLHRGTIRPHQRPRSRIHRRLLDKPISVHFGLLKASDMILLRLDGTVIGGNRSRPANAAGFLIHAAVHKRRPDVHAICHAHTIYGKTWSSFARPLEMLNQDVCKFYKAHSVYSSYGGVVLAEEEGELIATALGDGKAAILMNHGLLSVGGTVDEAAYLFGCLERCCQAQLLAEAAAANGIEKVYISDEQAAYNFAVESDPEVLYCEFQPDYEYEDAMCAGAFKK
ncbi:aldolase [Trichophyton rubrum]|uniref:Aldolase n=3 Tax=Trichophyton rubrum TaxID=5551 RepID=A0A178ETL5_TRIRU|nr:aldolase [Trichophyton rubrum]